MQDLKISGTRHELKKAYAACDNVHFRLITLLTWNLPKDSSAKRDYVDAILEVKHVMRRIVIAMVFEDQRGELK